MLRRFCCVPHFFSSEGYGDVISTFITKFAARWIRFSAFWAFDFQFMTASIAEYGVFRILTPAFWAIHSDDFQLKGQKVKLNMGKVRVVNMK